MTALERSIDGPSTSALQRRALGLAWATVAWNVIEAAVAISAGLSADSVVLIGFGLDSTIEVGSAAVIIWQFSNPDQDRESRALRLIAISFFALAAFVAGQAILDLAARNEPESSIIGIVIAIASLVVMPVLARAKRLTASELDSSTLAADGQQTTLCAYLSVILLVGLLLNATFAWWWADPVAAIGVAVLAFSEGRSAWRGDNCCD